MKSPLNILHLEDDPQDAALVQAALEAGGIVCATTCVENRVDFLATLKRGGIDLILSDFSLPAFDGLSALEIVRAQWPDIPLIFVSGTLGEERAIDSLKSGATDYVLKERLSRLAPAVRRAMRETDERAKRCQVESELEASEQSFANAFEYAPIGMALASPDGQFLKVNRSLCETVGYSEAELLSRTFQDITHAEDLEADMEHMRQLLEGKTRFYQMEKRYLHRDGRAVTILLSVSLVRNPLGEPLYFISQIQDITANKQLEAQFVEAQKMEVIGQLAGGVAHDFNNILAVIMGYGNLMMLELAPDGFPRKCAEEIQQAAERAVALTRQLLVFSRKQTVQPVVLDLNRVIEDLDKMLRRLIDENIELTILPVPEIGHIKADAGQVGQVLMNLVVNARDAMPNGGKLKIAASNVTLGEDKARNQPGMEPGDYVLLTVSDTGTGMTDEVKERLFEAFFTTKPKGQGTGLGLATCQTIVKQSNGFIAVESRLGQGTIFRVYFPVVEQPLTISAEQLMEGPLPRGTETLLLVEDEPSVRHLAASVLEAQGYTVLRANNGQDGLHMAREHKGEPISLVVTDVIMPRMGGKVMAEWLQATYPDIKILFTSGYTDDAIAKHGVLETGVHFLPKPYTTSILIQRVREMLDGPVPANEGKTP
ncbi:MAG: response regulator [Chthoniobacterales bacterium]